MLVVKDVHPRETVVGVLGRVMDAVVVVPERPRLLAVRVEVGLHLAWHRDVRGVAVVLRQRRGPVQVGRGRPLPGVAGVPRGHGGVRVRRRRHVQQVGLVHDDRVVVRDPDRRSRDHPVVAEHRGLVARHDLGHPEGLHDVEARVVPGRAVPATLVSVAGRRDLGRRHERQGEGLRHSARRHATGLVLGISDALPRQHSCDPADGGDLQQVTSAQRHDGSPEWFGTCWASPPHLKRRCQPSRHPLGRTLCAPPRPP